ncbi:MAG: hypothetical protein PHT33_01180 [bacterium]|nr:hypothetical protein [bacterium]
MNVQFLYSLNVVMISRLFLLFRDSPLSVRDTALMIFIQLVGIMLLAISYKTALLMLLLVLIGIVLYRFDKQSDGACGPRMFSLALYALVFGIFTSSSVSVHFNSELARYATWLGKYFLMAGLLENVDGHAFNSYLTGLLLATSEANLLVRYIFGTLDMVPGTKDKARKIDRHEYKAGRIIGVLERFLVYIFVLRGQFAAIGFIMAAKGFTRFKELDSRPFAEYVLIGTLLSVSLALLAALFAQTL